MTTSPLRAFAVAINGQVLLRVYRGQWYRQGAARPARRSSCSRRRVRSGLQVTCMAEHVVCPLARRHWTPARPGLPLWRNNSRLPAMEKPSKNSAARSRVYRRGLAEQLRQIRIELSQLHKTLAELYRLPERSTCKASCETGQRRSP
jgi:hypothetical protein